MEKPEAIEPEKSPEALWDRLLRTIRGKVSEHVWRTWFHPIRFIEIKDNGIKLAVTDDFTRDWLKDHYASFLADEIALIFGSGVGVEWTIAPGPLTFEESVSKAERPAASVAESADSRRPRRALNPRYVFDNFVCGPSNQFALAACRAVAENPAASYNPLFLFGGVGLGKTHLLSAIGHQILQTNPASRVVYTSSEQFVNEVINAVRFSKLDEFHGKYRRNCDVILMDDIQLIAGKDRTQHEFFHIFNTLYDSQRQIVVTSDKLPHEIPEIEERLRNRFQWGLIADIQPPEIETRVAILSRKAESERIHLNEEVAFFLAKNIRSNVRELEGALIRLMAHASLTGVPITVEYARQVLADILNHQPEKISVENIQKTVATYFHVRVADLKSSRRHKVLIRPRQVAMYLCRKHAGASYPDLGSRFGDKDHTTVMSACKKVDKMLQSDPSIRQQVLDLERQLDVVNR